MSLFSGPSSPWLAVSPASVWVEQYGERSEGVGRWGAAGGFSHQWESRPQAWGRLEPPLGQCGECSSLPALQVIVQPAGLPRTEGDASLPICFLPTSCHLQGLQTRVF